MSEMKVNTVLELINSFNVMLLWC